ncbi:MAG: RagB/SusD family nutrient uptake outer membrane protein [Bacteroidales bacterium]|nr:RagB/SusD family nutrient uptake outer membrane protein [Bacteroidales bacterium]
MKKNIILFAAVLLLFSSCEKALDRNPLNGPSTGTFPSSEAEALSGVLVSYKNLANATQQYCPFPTRFVDNLTDIGTVRVGLSSWNMFVTSTLTQTTSAATSLYSRIYRTAGRIHLVLDNLDNIKGTMSEETYLQFKAELLCLRAYIYDMGCQFYGDIPFIDHCLSLTDYSYPRVPKEQVIDRILWEMDDNLLDALPVRWDKFKWGTCRLGRAAAYTLKARICLNWGRFADAARYSAKAMELSEGIYALEPLDCTYYPTAETEGEPSAANLFGFAGEQSDEWMWAIQYNELAASNTHSMVYTYSSRVSNGAAGCGPSQALMDTFQCTDGKSIAESPLYDWQNPYAHRDPRLDLFCLRSNTRINNVQYSTDPTVREVWDYNIEAKVNNSDVYGNKSEYGPNGTKGPGGYLWRKFADASYYGKTLSANFNDDLDACVIRYAELLLIDAEANIEMEGGDLRRAQNDINQIRQRVKMPKITSYVRADLRSALRYERTVELCAEGFRWFDIRRWKSSESDMTLAEVVMNGPQYAPAFKNNISNAKPIISKDWTVSYNTSSTWDNKAFNLRTLINMYYQPGKDELWPLPDTEIRSNPAISQDDQNPGY